jgi:Ca2+-binding RTX toxin-like protein
MMIQSLEPRRLFAASLANGVITIEGTVDSDDIRVGSSPARDILSVRINGALSTFSLKLVTRVVVLTHAGNDQVDLSGTSLPSRVKAGAGNDTLIGGAAGDNINGGAGNDTILGESGPDTLNGDAGEDSIRGGDGRDSVNGGDGNDRLWTGGGSKNFLSGGAGDDELHARNNDPSDAVYGGLGRDKAWLECSDITHNGRNDHAHGVETEEWSYWFS